MHCRRMTEDCNVTEEMTNGTLQRETEGRLGTLKSTPQSFKHSTHQTDEDTDELNDIGVGHSVEAAEEGVEDGDAGGEDDGDCVVQVEYHTEGRS